MDDTFLPQRWLGRLIFTTCAFVILLIGLVPLGFTPRVIPGPDLLLCLTLAFALRRSEYVPVWLLAVVFFLADILLLRPPGLWTAIVILAVELTRLQEYRFRELIFPFEWAFVGAIMFFCLIANRLILSLTVVPQAGFSTVMLHFLTSIAAYPLVVAFCTFALRVRKLSPNEAIRQGHRL